jgi:membrane protein DedA with SNARE-associated domain
LEQSQIISFPYLLEHPYLSLFLLLILGGIGLPFPEDAILILCGIFISSHSVEPIPALLVVYSGMLITDFGLHYVGRKYGRLVVTHRRFHRVISPERLKIIEEKFHRWGILFILVGRHLVVLRAQVFLVSGILHMPVWKFIIADAIAGAVTMGLLVGAGYAGGHYLHLVEKDMDVVKYVLGVIVAIFLVGTVIYWWWMARRNRAPEGSPPQDGPS